MKKWYPEFVGRYPYVSRDISKNGEEVVVKSHKHRRQLMKENGLSDDKYSKETIQKRKKWFQQEQKEKREKDIKVIWQKVKRGTVDTRVMKEARDRIEYERRNGRG